MSETRKNTPQSAHSQLGAGHRADTTTETPPPTTEAGRLLSNRQPYMDELRSEHQAQNLPAVGEINVEEAQKREAVVQQEMTDVGIESGGEPHRRHKELPPESKEIEERAAAEIGQTKEQLKEPGKASRGEV